jgi:hypothetical protein
MPPEAHILGRDIVRKFGSDARGILFATVKGRVGGLLSGALGGCFMRYLERQEREAIRTGKYVVVAVQAVCGCYWFKTTNFGG